MMRYALTPLNSGCIQLSQLWQVVDLSKGVSDIPEWFHGCCFNYAENVLRYSDMDGSKTAIITCGKWVHPTQCCSLMFSSWLSPPVYCWA